MEISSEVLQATKNIRYYGEKIKTLAKQQIDHDIQIGNVKGFEIDPVDRRFNCLGIMQTNADWFDIYCNNIEANVRHAEEEDDKFLLKEEKENQNGNSET